MTDSLSLVLLCSCAAVAGFVDSVVGGGGLIQLPALFLWLPPVEASTVAGVFGTNKLSSACGTTLAMLQYARRIRLNWEALLPAAATALIFSWLGARTVASLRPELLKPLILILLIAVAVYTYSRKGFGERHNPVFSGRTEKWIGVVVGAGIGFYDGFFGPGTGSFLIFIFIGVFGFDFLTASASSKVINFTTNVAAVAYFAFTGNIHWRFAIPMAVCNVAGSLVGTRIALTRGNRFVRALFLIVVTALIARFAFDVVHH